LGLKRSSRITTQTSLYLSTRLMDGRPPGYPLYFPERHPFNPIPMLRLCIASGCSKKAVDSIFKCIWEEGLVGDDPDNWNAFCSAVGLSVSEANELISKTEIKSELKSNGKNAIEQGVYGVPTLVVDGHLFWGYDSTNLSLDYLVNPDCSIVLLRND